MKCILYSIFISLFIGCTDIKPKVLSDSMTNVKLPDDWYQSKAEINVYNLQQNRYSGIHEGQAILIFVTEDFLTDKQVKNDNYTADNSVGILKTNRIRRFSTGVYDYSIFTSIFTDATKAKTYKVTSSSQDWCGQTYMQLNRKDSNYGVEIRSYFENEGDQEFKVNADVLEDEIPNLIRLDDSQLPIGEFEILPSVEFARLQHKDFKAVKAIASRSDISGKPGLVEYKIEMPSLSRTLTFVYDSAGLRPILQWTDTYPSTFDNMMRTTVATLSAQKWQPYWSQNSLSDKGLRAELGIK